jgi:transposase-like protein
MANGNGHKNGNGNGHGHGSRYKEHFATIAEGMCRRGAIDADLAERFGVHIQTIYSWREQHEEFDAALKINKEVVDTQVENALLKRAKGFTYMEQVLTKQGEIVSIERTVLPEVIAQIYWLNNRRPDLWRHTNRHELTGADGKPLNLSPAVVIYELPENGRQIETEKETDSRTD